MENIWSHNDLSLEVRYSTFNWLLNLATAIRGPSTSITCVRFALHIVDRYVQECGTHACRLDLRFVAITALFLAAKMFNPMSPDPADYADAVRLSVEELLVMEMDVLRSLDFCMFDATSACCSAVRHARDFKDATPTLNHAFVYFADLSMLDWHLHLVSYTDLESVARVFLEGPPRDAPWLKQLVLALDDERGRNKKRRTALANRHLGKPYMLKVVDDQLKLWLAHFAAVEIAEPPSRKRKLNEMETSMVKKSKIIEVQKTLVVNRCMGKTVKGTRCKRWAKNKTEYCRLHM